MYIYNRHVLEQVANQRDVGDVLLAKWKNNKNHNENTFRYHS